jgi:conjugative transfer pilus assembly protein TraH
MTLRQLSLFMVITFNTPLVFADPMQDVFNDMYSTSAPSASVHGNGRYGVNLGGFSYRPKLSAGAPLISARLPNANIGPCGEIDIFAGSFSLISGDELAQMSRGIMQGAATYAFNLALQSISPMAAGVVEELRTLVNGANQFNIDGCKKGAEWAEKALGSGDATPSTEMSFVANKLSSLNVSMGFSPDANEAQHGATSKKPASELAEQVGKKIQQNSLLSALKKSQPSGFLFSDFGGVKENELALTILGATVTTTDSTMCSQPFNKGEKTCVTYAPGKGAAFFMDLFFNANNIDSSSDTTDIEYYKCSDPDCVIVTKATTTVTQLLPKLRKQIFDVWQKTYKQPTAAYTTDESNMMFWFGNDMYLMMKKFGANDVFGESYAKYKSIEATAVIMDYMAQDLVEQVGKALTIAKTNQNNDQIYPVGLTQSEKDLKAFVEGYQALRDGDISKRISENRANLGTSISLLLGSKS